MPRFEHSPLADINHIRNNLNNLDDRYHRYHEGFPIIKELLQNADDAEASRLHIGWFPGFRDIDHPLLTGPALFIVNDGEFKSKDQDGIKHFGISAKASDQTAIGKFGLGLKSVFHWCEAFFYFWPEQKDTFEILNPWYGKDPPNHDDWECEGTSSIASEARQAIDQCLESATPNLLGFPNWLCLWIPLRQQHHCGKVSPIRGNFPGDENMPPASIFFPNLAHHIGKTLPLLRDLKTVSAWAADGKDRNLEMRFEVNLEENAKRCRYRGSESGISTTDYGRQLPLQGDVKVTEQSRINQCSYAGFEMMADHPIFRELPSSQSWPAVGTIDPKTGAEREEKEKADSHCAAYFVETPAEDGGSLRIQWAVVLPVGDPKETKPCEGKSDFTLTLHGYFFPNAGRTDIDLPDDINQPIGRDFSSESDIRPAWNRELLVSGTLPLVIPAWDRFVAARNLDDPTVHKLTGALQKSKTFNQYRRFICRDTQWVRRLRAHGSAWEQLDNPNAEILEIPPPPNSAPNRPDEVFPNLRELARQHVIVFHGDPRLTAQKEASKWRPELLTLMLRDVPVEAVFGDRGMLKYFVRFLKDCTEDALSGVFDVLQQLISHAFATVDLGQLRGNRSEIKNYLALLGNNSCFPIPKNLSGEVFQRLFQLELRVLLVPEDLIPEEPHQLLVESLCNEDALKILEFVSTLGENRELERPERTFVQQVITASHWDEIRAQCDSFRIFTAYDCRTRSNVSISLSQLTGLRRKRTLFACSGSQAMPLQQALDNASVTLIDKPTLEKLGWDDEIVQCNEHACLQVLDSKPALNCPEERVNLLNALLPKIEGIPEHKEAVRYLIHAHPSDDNMPLFTKTGREQEPRSNIICKILRLKNEEWRVIDKVLGGRISPHFWQLLGIYEFNVDSITQLILDVGPEHLDCSIFRPYEREQILQESDDFNVLRRLNIYDDVNGNLVRINLERTYWQDDFQIEDIPRENITILRPLPNSLSWKQELLLDRFFTAEAALHVLLGTENPHQRWEQILKALEHLNTVPSEFRQELKDTTWLPIAEGRCPRETICLRGMEDEVHRIVSGCDDLYVDVLMLPVEFRDHPGYGSAVRPLFPLRDAALEMLGQVMARDERYRIGDIDTENLDLNMFLDTFQGPSPHLMPASAMMRGVCEAFDEAVCRRCLLPNLCQNIPTTRIVDILNFLSERHTAAPRNSKSKILDIFNQYLTAATKAPEFSRILEQIRLLSRDGNWKSPAELCLDAEGIQCDDLLDTEQSEIVRDCVQSSTVLGSRQSQASQPLEGNEEQQFDRSAARLKQYFDAWHGVVQDEVVGGFIALLGNHSQLLALSGQYLGNRTVDGFRERLNRDWNVQRGSSAVGANENIHQTMRRQRFLAEVFEGDTIEVTNLVRSPFHARIKQAEFDSLFVGSANEQFRPETGMNYRVNRIRLRLVQPDRLLDLVKNSAGLLLNKVYKQTIQNLDIVFNDLAQSEQLDVRVAQNLLLDSAFFYVQQLEMRQVDDGLSTALQKWDEARRLRTEAEHTGDPDMVNGAVEELQLEQQELQNLIQSDEAAQHSLLTAVRCKIRQYQYTHQSVPFELFQNADDAVVESFEMYGDSPPDPENTDTTRFVIQQEDDKITFIHWGRPINKFRSAQLNGRARGFHKDLEKMLILSNSDKSESPGNVTGKFGLGFKSVFLVTSKPRVASGQLGFEAVGGFFPKQLTGEPLRELQNQIETCQNDGREGTIISLQAEQCSVEECLKEFWDVIHFIPVFARRIRKCEWIMDGQRESWEWNDKPLGQCEGVGVGKLQPSSDSQQLSQNVVVFRARQGDLLVALDVHGVVKLEKSVPTVWVTVPTKQKCDVSFIVNGRFDLDVGRLHLASDSQNNRVVADSIGREIGDSLIELFNEADRDWDNFCVKLDLARGADRYQFWLSLWCLFGRGVQEESANAGEAIQLIQQILWKSREHGMSKLLSHRAAVPSGLWGEYETLTKLDKIQFKTVGALDTESVFCKASKWPQFQQEILPGHVVSHGKIASLLMSLLLDENLIMQEVTLCSRLQRELGESHCVDASQASQLGSLITREFLDALDRGNQNQRNEYDKLVDFLSNIRFQGSDGQFHAAADLLMRGEGVDNQDERCWAAFAPNERLLAGDYNGNALEFFKASRSDEPNAPPELIAQWAMHASDDQKRLAALKYLLEGQLRREVAFNIWNRIAGTWLHNLATSPLLTDHFDSYQRSIILGELRLYDEGAIVPPTPPPGPLVTLEPAAVLEDIHAWWIHEGDNRISEYEESVYGGFRLQLSDKPDWEDSQIRENWLTLFMLGALHTMGWVQPEQNRSFIRLWRENEWLQVFASPRTNREARMEVLEQFLEQSGETIEFYDWMRQYVSFVQFANWLNDYGDAFLEIDKLFDRFSLTDITRLRSSSRFQGSDFDAPSIDRTLGIGAYFVVRELMRLGILSSVHAYPHCYTPVRRVRNLLESIGCRGLDSDASQSWEQSVAIYEFLSECLGERATFNGAFDIPFLIITDDEELERRFFGENILQNEDDKETRE